MSRSGGDVGWSRSLNRLHGTLKGGRKVDMWMRSTLAFRKVGGAWKIAHGHSSVPFLMDGSFRAATDLEPRRRLTAQSGPPARGGPAARLPVAVAGAIAAIV